MSQPSQPSRPSPPVAVEVVGSALQVRLDRPEKRNALDRASAEAVAEALDELDRRADLRCAVLTGAGGNFSAGMDLAAFARGERPTIEGRGLLGFGTRSPRKPVIAAVEGWAVGGGFEVALACDLVVAARDARFALPEARRGLVAAGGGLVRLAQRIPQARAMELALTGRVLGAEEAADWGLVNRLTDTGGALAAAHELAAEIAASAPLSVAVSKEIVRAAPDWEQDAWHARQQDAITPLIGSRDVEEGARAFLEKRPPVWTGA